MGGGGGRDGGEKEAGERRGEERRGEGRGGEGRGGRREERREVVPAHVVIVPCSKRREGFPPSIQKETGVHSERGSFSKCRN